MTTFDAILYRLSVADTPETLDALGRVLAKQFAANGDDTSLFRLRLALDDARKALRAKQANASPVVRSLASSRPTPREGGRQSARRSASASPIPRPQPRTPRS